MPVAKEVNAQRVMDRIEALASLSSMQGAITRAYLTEEHKQANKHIAAWMQQAGMHTWQDEVGNQWGRLEAKHPVQDTLIIGSHSDTVVNAGRYDGTLGVLLAIEAAEKLNSHELPFHLDVVAFADEEGVRFGTTLLGSSGVCGTWDSSWLSIEGADGISMGQAMQDFGLDIASISNADRSKDRIKAYLEVHIEQGPVLDNLSLPVGVVTGIAGAKRFLINVKGEAGHAGTVPLALRADALCATANLITVTETYAMHKNIVATVGKCTVVDAAVNVIPGDVQFSLDIRSQDQTLLDSSCDALLEQYQHIATERGVTLHIEDIYQAKSVPCDSNLQALWLDVVKNITGKEALSLASGAGHDAMMMSNITPMSMLFVRCEKGISHNPLEAVNSYDVGVALDSLVEMIQMCAKSER